MSDSNLHVLGALALELAPGSAAAHLALPQREAGALAGLIARDLARHAADAVSLQLITVGAHYDPVELLRPGWPLHRELDELGARAPPIVSPSPAGGETLERRQAGEADKTGRIIAFGSHDGQLPGALMPTHDFAGGPLRLLPFVLGGAVDVVARVGDAFERELLERGMAAADTALAAQEAFGLQVEHARYLTVHDLAAMMALQYEHMGLAPLWPLLETALLQADGEQWLDVPPEPLLHYVDREVRIALFEPQAWRARYAGAAQKDCTLLERRFAQFEARQRQFAAVLGAHGVPVTFVYCGGNADPAPEL